MPFDLKSALLATVFAFSALAACGEDHRTEDFCNMLCECENGSGPDDFEQCSGSCFAVVDGAEQSSGVSPVSDACYACINNTSCQLYESNCTDDCAGFIDALEQPEQNPGETN